MFDKLMESFGYHKKEDIFKGAPSSVDTSMDHIDSLSEQSIWAMVDSIRDLSATTDQLYAEYDVIATDAVIGSALDMYADDATQTGSESTRLVKVVSEDKSLAADLTAFLDSIEADRLLWSTAYNTAKYGDHYWRVHLNNTRDDIDSIEVIDHPAHVVDLYKDGERVNYGYDDRCVQEGVINAAGAVNPNMIDEYSLYSPRSFVHFQVKSADYMPTIKLVDPKKLDKNGDPEILQYKISRGKSMLEDVRSIYRILRALEDSLLASRLARSEYIRIHNVEVGTNTTGPATKKMIDRVKRLFDSDQSLDLNEGYYASHKKARPFMDPIFNPVRDGKGAITTDVLGGDFDVRSIVDVDYFKNKLFAALKIPASFLGYEENLQGHDQGDMLAQLDIRYARSLKKLITALEEGLTDLCNIWLSVRGRGAEVGKARVSVLASSINEERLRVAELESRVETITNLASSITREVEGVNSAEIMSVLMKEYIPDEIISEKLVKVLEDAKVVSELSQKIAYQEKVVELAQMDEEFLDSIKDQVREEVLKEISEDRGSSGGVSSPREIVFEVDDQTEPGVDY